MKNVNNTTIDTGRKNNSNNNINKIHKNEIKTISRKNIPKRLKEQNTKTDKITNENLNEISNTDRTETNTLKENLKNKLPSYNIENLDTNIKIFDKKTYGQVTENAKFVLKNGSFTSIIRKISLAGSSDSIIAFKVSSK